jgi:hypothetical protein
LILNPVQTGAVHLQAQGAARARVFLGLQVSEWNLKSSNLK